MNDDPVEVLEAMAARAAVARRVGEAELEELARRRAHDPLAHARAEVRVKLALFAATMGLRWLRSLEAEGRVGTSHAAELRRRLERVTAGQVHPSQVMDREGPDPYSRPDTVTSVGCPSPHADFDATARADGDRS
jgi:hypothetical protein